MVIPMAMFLEEFGGHEAVFAVVDRFYRRAADDPRLAEFFRGMDMQRLQRKMRVLVTILLTGSAAFAEHYLSDAHGRLRAKSALNDEHFDAVIEHFDMALKDSQVPAAARGRLLSVVEDLRNAVLGRSEPGRNASEDVRARRSLQLRY